MIEALFKNVEQVEEAIKILHVKENEMERKLMQMQHNFLEQLQVQKKSMENQLREQEGILNRKLQIELILH